MLLLEGYDEQSGVRSEVASGRNFSRYMAMPPFPRARASAEQGGLVMEEGFFDRVEQVDLELVGKKWKLPIFYRAARMFTLVLPANYLALRRMLPDVRLRPAQMLPGVGAVHLTAFEYYDTDVEPYNEFAIGILVNNPNFMAVPSYNVLRQLVQNQFYTYIHHLPVTTELALRAGIDFYNYPKLICSIDFEDDGDWVACDLAEAGEKICRIRGRKMAANRSGIMKFFCQLYDEDQPQQAEMKINARRFTIMQGPGNAELVLGDSHPFAAELKKALLTTMPGLYMYVPDLQAILYGPEHLSFTTIANLARLGLGADLAEVGRLVAGQGQPAA